ncbi:hypothetical protein AB0L49_50935 [Streptomyces antimycoticus]|uniref:hypothetical protein n=1 Tax=Streptomyces antimycoticus TaxID=68175 RepID=UPI00341E3454
MLDHRCGERLLQSHAGLWPTPLAGVDLSKVFGGVWSDVLDQAERVLPVGFEEAEAVGGDSPLQSMPPRIAAARRAAAGSRLGAAATSLGCGETLAQPLQLPPAAPDRRSWCCSLYRAAAAGVARCIGPLLLVLLVLLLVLLGCCPVGRACVVICKKHACAFTAGGGCACRAGRHARQLCLVRGGFRRG